MHTRKQYPRTPTPSDQTKDRFRSQKRVFIIFFIIERQKRIRIPRTNKNHVTIRATYFHDLFDHAHDICFTVLKTITTLSSLNSVIVKSHAKLSACSTGVSSWLSLHSFIYASDGSPAPTRGIPSGTQYSYSPQRKERMDFILTNFQNVEKSTQ